MADMEFANDNKQNINLCAVIKKEHEEVIDDECVEDISGFINIKVEPFEPTATIIDTKSNDERNSKTKQMSGPCNDNSHIVSTYLDDEQQIPKFQVKEESEKMSTASMANMELADENKQNINLNSIIKKENEDIFDNGYVENISSFINIKEELSDSTETVIDSNLNDKRSLNTKQISETCNMNCQVVSTYCDDEQQIFEFQVKEESEKISDAVMELDQHGEQNKNLYPVKVKDESFEHSGENNTNNFIEAKNELFEATETDVQTGISEFIKNHQTSNIQKSKESPILKYLLASGEESHNKHKLADLRTRDSNVYIIHPDKNGDELMVDEVALHDQSVREDVSEKLILKESKNMFLSKEIETDQIQSRFKDNVLNSVKSRQLRTYTGDKPFTCDVCHKSFSEKFNLKTHLKTHTGEKPFTCEVCNKTFSLGSYLRIHLRTHTGEKPFNCELCHKSFSQRIILEMHLRTHTGEKPFNCEICHKSFSRKSILKIHLGTHTGEKPFTCEICHKSFSQSGHLKRHLRTHTGDKPFNCEVCNKSFSRRSHLKDHLKTHAEEKPSFNCEVCKKSFSNWTYFKRHLKSHTKEEVKALS